MASVPYVPNPTVSPTSQSGMRQSVDGVSADAFGAAGGRAMQGLGKALADSLDWLGQMDAREKAYGKEADLTDYQQRSAKAYEDASNNLTGDGKGFLVNFMNERKKDADSVLAKHNNDPQVALRLKQINLGLYTRALPVEQRKMNEFYGKDIEDKLGPFLMQTQNNPDPKGVEKTIADANRLIDASGLSPAMKEQYKAAAADRIKLAYGMGAARDRPDDVLGTVQGGAGESYFRKLRVVESGNNPNARPRDASGKLLSSAQGYYQWTTGTWESMVAKYGKSHGLTLNGRGNIEQEEKAIRLFTEENKKILDANGIPVTEKNLYAMHFFGAGDGPKFLKALRDNPNATAAQLFPTAAGSNGSIFYQKGDPESRRAFTVAEVYNRLTGKFGGKDAIISSLSPENQMKLEGMAGRQVQQNIKMQMAEQAQQEMVYFNNSLTRAASGDYTRQDFQVDVGQGRIAEPRMVQALDKAITAREEEDAKETRALGKLVSPNGYSWSKHNKEDVEDFDRIAATMPVKEGESREQALMSLIARTGFTIVPSNLVNQLRGMAASGNAQQMAMAGQMISELQDHNPGIFSGHSGQAELARLGATYNMWAKAGLSPEGIAAKMGEEWEREAKGVNITSKAESDIRTRLRKEDPSAKVMKELGAVDPADGVMSYRSKPEIKKEMNEDYIELFMDEYQRSGREDQAHAVAMAQMKQLYGVFGDELMKYPPHMHGYIPSKEQNAKTLGGWKYFLDDMRATAQRHAGTNDIVEPFLIPTTRTVNDVRAGRLPTYTLLYGKKNENGIVIFHAAPGYKGPSPAAANAEFDSRIDQRSRGEFPIEEVPGQRKQDLHPGWGASETDQQAKDRLTKEIADKKAAEAAKEETTRKFLERNKGIADQARERGNRQQNNPVVK